VEIIGPLVLLAPFALIIGFVALVVVLVVLGFKANKKRNEELAIWAMANGLTFSMEEDHSIDERYPWFDVFREGDDRYAQFTIQGEVASRPITAFDYHYETHSTDSKGNRETTDHHFSAVIVDVGFVLKPLTIRPESILDKIGSVFGANDIDFESTEFSKAFCVQAPDKKWAFDVIQQSTMEFLLASRRYQIVFGGLSILIFDGSCFSAQEYQEALTVVNGVLDRLPEYLLREHKGQA